MQRSIRVLTAAFAIAVASLGGALYLGHERAAERAGGLSFDPAGDGIASLDVSSLLSDPKTADRRMLDVTFQQLERTYYKPIETETLLAGEQKELVLALRRHHAANPTLPAVVANGDDTHDLAAIDGALATARTRFAKFDPDVESDLTQSAIRGMMSSLGDPYTVYLPAREINALEESLKGGDFGGIGVYLVQDRAKRVYVEPIEGTPADRAGIKTGDEIVRVNGETARSLALEEIERRIRGPVGTSVALQVRSHGKPPRTVPVTRRQIMVPSVHAKMEDGFEYVRLSEFGSTSYDEVRRALLDGKSHGAKGYILDLRNNGGGLLEAAVQISSLFIADGAIVSTIDRAGDRDTKDALHTNIGTMPLVVLVNKYTASASEITAGAVQDYKVGELIGTKTFGKGVVQSINTLPDGGALKITTARYVTPLGRDIHHKGIPPDIHVDQTVDFPIIDTKADVQLAAAKKYLRGGSTAAASTLKNGHS